MPVTVHTHTMHELSMSAASTSSIGFRLWSYCLVFTLVTARLISPHFISTLSHICLASIAPPNTCFASHFVRALLFSQIHVLVISNDRIVLSLCHILGLAKLGHAKYCSSYWVARWFQGKRKICWRRYPADL